MSGNNIVLDTNVIIFASKQQLHFDKILDNYDNVFVSIITYMEVYGYNFGNPIEKNLLDAFFKNIEIVPVDISIADIVIDYRSTSLKKIKLPDAIILATSKAINATLLTDDWDDFLNIDSTVNVLSVEPYKIKK